MIQQGDYFYNVEYKRGRKVTDNLFEVVSTSKYYVKVKRVPYCFKNGMLIPIPDYPSEEIIKKKKYVGNRLKFKNKLTDRLYDKEQAEYNSSIL